MLDAERDPQKKASRKKSGQRKLLGFRGRGFFPRLKCTDLLWKGIPVGKHQRRAQGKKDGEIVELIVKAGNIDPYGGEQKQESGEAQFDLPEENGRGSIAQGKKPDQRGSEGEERDAVQKMENVEPDGAVVVPGGLGVNIAAFLHDLLYDTVGIEIVIGPYGAGKRLQKQGKKDDSDEDPDPPCFGKRRKEGLEKGPYGGTEELPLPYGDLSRSAAYRHDGDLVHAHPVALERSQSGKDHVGGEGVLGDLCEEGRKDRRSHKAVGVVHIGDLFPEKDSHGEPGDGADEFSGQGLIVTSPVSAEKVVILPLFPEEREVFRRELVVGIGLEEPVRLSAELAICLQDCGAVAGIGLVVKHEMIFGKGLQDLPGPVFGAVVVDMQSVIAAFGKFFQFGAPLFRHGGNAVLFIVDGHDDDERIFFHDGFLFAFLSYKGSFS